MEHNREEIINALNVIQDVCNKHKDECEYCPLAGVHGECLIRYSYPEGWIIKKSEKEIRRAFR